MLMAWPAAAADIYTGGSFKDGPIAYYSDHSGFYITGALGFAHTDYDFDRITTAERIETDPDLSRFFIYPPFNYDDSNTSIYGGVELSYLFHSSQQQIGFRPFVSANWNGGDDVDFSRDFEVDVATPAGDIVGVPVPASNTFSVSKDGDINAGLDLMFFPSQNTALFIGGGVSWGRFSAKATNTFDGGGNAFDLNYSEEDDSVGYLGRVGAQWWINQKLSIGILGEVRGFDDISFSDSRSTPEQDPNDPTIERNIEDNIDGDVFEYAIKGTVSYCWAC